MIRELQDEFKIVAGRNNRISDVVIPPLIFLIVNRFVGQPWAIGTSLFSALIFLIYRLMRGQSLWYALGGLTSAGLAAGLSLLTDSPGGYFLPGLISSGSTSGLAILSNLAQRPLVAWTSHLTRGWPIHWYWHERIRPAYSEVTWGWALFFAARFYIQWQTYLGGSVLALGIIQLLSGWPALIALLTLSYIYGTWRLRNLRGPSVDEFEAGSNPPWDGQQRGF